MGRLRRRETAATMSAKGRKVRSDTIYSSCENATCIIEDCGFVRHPAGPMSTRFKSAIRRSDIDALLGHDPNALHEPPPRRAGLPRGISASCPERG
jgi:hypothetical protein